MNNKRKPSFPLIMLIVGNCLMIGFSILFLLWFIFFIVELLSY